MPDLTEEEYDALNEYWTKHTPQVSGDGKSGFFAKHKGNIVILDDVSAAYLRVKSEARYFTSPGTEIEWSSLFRAMRGSS
jgi:hypothetical protein